MILILASFFLPSHLSFKNMNIYFKWLYTPELQVKHVGEEEEEEDEVTGITGSSDDESIVIPTEILPEVNVPGEWYCTHVLYPSLCICMYMYMHESRELGKAVWVSVCFTFLLLKFSYTYIHVRTSSSFD